jgi:predicted acetyltransferase
MTVEIRAARDAEEMKAYARIVSYVFAENDPDGMDEELATTLPEWTTCAFVDGQMAGTLGAFPFTVRLNGAPVAMGGVTAVGTLPQYRRRGLLRQVMRQALETMRERGQSYAILWASMAAIYQRFGYGMASTSVGYRFDPRYAAFQSPREASGSIELMTKDDAFPILKQIYVQAATPRNLYIHRSTPLWQVSTLRAKKDEKLYIAIYRNADGEPRGHLVYLTAEHHVPNEPGPAQVMTVKDFIALDMDAYRGLWEFIRRHDLVGTVDMRGAVGEDDPAPELLLEPRMLRRTTSDGIWMRVVDVEKAVPQRPYGDRGELTFAIAGDDMCPWNNGTYLMETDGTITDIRRSDRTPELAMSPNELASLLSGHRPASHLARAGRLRASDKDSLLRADRIFRTEYAPHCPNGF